jgi:hypothetical protein
MLLIKWHRVQGVIEWYDKFEKIIGKKPDISDFRKTNDYNLLVRTDLVILFELIWLIIGLFMGNWLIVSSIILYGFILKYGLSRIKWTLTGKIVSYKYLIMRIAIYSILILKHFN